MTQPLSSYRFWCWPLLVLLLLVGGEGATAQLDPFFPSDKGWQSVDSVITHSTFRRYTEACCAQPHEPMGHGPWVKPHYYPPWGFKRELAYSDVHPWPFDTVVNHLDTVYHMVTTWINKGKGVALLQSLEEAPGSPVGASIPSFYHPHERSMLAYWPRNKTVRFVRRLVLVKKRHGQSGYQEEQLAQALDWFVAFASKQVPDRQPSVPVQSVYCHIGHRQFYLLLY